MKTRTYSQSRARYAETLNAVTDDREEIVITRAGRDRSAGGRWRDGARSARMKLIWDESAGDDYVWWQSQDRKVINRINTLIKDVERHCNEGIGKPEPLKHGFHGYWSRRITDEHRLVYKVSKEEIRIAACRYHDGR